MMKKVVIMDLSAIMIAGIKGNKSRLWNTGGFPTGGLYNIFGKLVPEIKSGSIVYVTADYPPYYKKSIYPEFKGERPETTELDRDIFRLQKTVIKHYADKIGYKYIEIKGYEADDIMYALAALYGNDPEYKVEIISADKDIHSARLYGDNISIISNTNKYKVDGDPSQVWTKFLNGGKDNIPSLARILNPYSFQTLQELVYKGYNQYTNVYALMEQGFDLEESELIKQVYTLSMPLSVSPELIGGKINAIEYDIQLLVDVLTSFGLNKHLKTLGKTYQDSNNKSVMRIQDEMYGRLTDNVIDYFVSKDSVFTNFVFETDEASDIKVKELINKLKQRGR